MITIVTGTDTGVGKTVATAALATCAEPAPIVVKPVQTGTATDDPDTATVRHLAGCETNELARLDDPLAPDTAARFRDVAIPPIGEHVSRIRELATTYDTVIVEGSGGLLVRLDTDGATLRDLADELSQDHPVRVFVVTRVGLGSLNHTSLTVEALRARDTEPTGLILGAVPDKLGLAEQRNLAELPRVTGVPIAAALPDGAGGLSWESFRSRASSWCTGSTTVHSG